MLDLNKITAKEWELLRSIRPIPELSPLFFQMSDYRISTKEHVLYPLVDAHDVIVVCGAFFGDEGKGKIVDAVARHPMIAAIARVNSGENAGHTVWHDGKKYVFHLAPSGLLIPNKANYIGPECVMDPVSFMHDEMNQLKLEGLVPNLTIGNVHIVGPYHKIADLAVNWNNNSSTLKGMAQVHASKVTKKCVRLDQLFGSKDDLRMAFKRDIEFSYAPLLKEISEAQIHERCLQMNEEARKNIPPELLNGVKDKVPSHILDFLKAKDKIGFLIDLYDRSVVNNPDFPRRGDVVKAINDLLAKGGKVMLEAAQGYFLSNKVEIHYSSSTSADTTSSGTQAAADYNQRKHPTITFNTTKLGPSRVGRGHNPCGFVTQTFFSDRGYNSLDDLAETCTDFDAIQRQFFNSIGENGIIKKELYTDADDKQYLLCEAMAIASSRKHEEFGATTKKPRVLGIVDCVAHHHVNRKQGPYFIFSAMDRGDDYDQVGLVVAYLVLRPGNSKGMDYSPGQIIKPGDQLPNEEVLKNCLPIIKVMPGWKDTPAANKAFAKGDLLPDSIRRFISDFEHYTGGQVISFGNGHNTDQLVYIEKTV